MGIKLVVSDLDGCLLKNDGTLPDNFGEAFDIMQQQGVVFAAASGRSATGMKRPFGTLADKIDLISDNGARVYHGNHKVSQRILPYEEYRPVVEEIRKHEGLLAVACGEKGAWVEDLSSVTDDMEQELLKYYPTWRECSFDHIPDRIIKFALLYFDDIEKNIYPVLRKFDNDRICIQVTAFVWIDVFEKGVSKGAGVAALQDELGISPAETVVFGDYLNDISMADAASASFAPLNAHRKVKERFSKVIGSNDEGSVPETIINLLSNNSQDGISRAGT